MPGSPLASTDESEFQGYTLTSRLGAGGMGIVYLATRPDLPYPVAVKVMRPELADDSGFRARFTREITAVRAVQGLHTVRIIDAGTAEGSPHRPSLPYRPYLVTEYIDGPALSELIASGPLGSGQVRLLARSLAVALSDIHDAGIVHRDLKPANVLMGRDGIKVIDFGIAQLADASTMLTGTGAAIGTAGYMAPEQIRGVPGPATDVFAWAVTVAHAASGRPPFGSGPTDAVIYRILHDEPDLSGLPPGLEEPVYAAAAKDPGQRPTAADLIAMLDGRITAPAPALAPAPSTAPLPTAPLPTALLPTAARPTQQATATPRPGGSRWRGVGRAVRRIATVAAAAALIGGVISVTGSQNTSSDESERGGADDIQATTSATPDPDPTQEDSGPPPAQRVRYNPFKGSTDPYGGPGPGYRILRHAYGSCASPSAVAPTREDAYACTGIVQDPPAGWTDAEVRLDPCFAPPEQAGQLLCPDTIEVTADGFSFRKVIQFEPTEGLADPAPSKSPADGSFYPIGVQLDDGTHCYVDPLAETEDGPQEQTMPCGAGFVTMRLDEPLEGWTGKFRAQQTTEDQAVTVKITKVFE